MILSRMVFAKNSNKDFKSYVLKGESLQRFKNDVAGLDDGKAYIVKVNTVNDPTKYKGDVDAFLHLDEWMSREDFLKSVLNKLQDGNKDSTDSVTKRPSFANAGKQ
jgi:hypothetical protein